jgi:hypothetical protein
MNEEDRSRFVANVGWFNRFFGGIRQLYEIVVETLPAEFFPEGFALNSSNFYFPRQNFAPTIPPYYVLMVGGNRLVLQFLAVFDQDQFGNPGLFAAEPSVVVVLHSRADRYGYVSDYALRVVGNRGLEIDQQADGKIWGKINAKLPADFFSFQVSFDKFSANKNSRDAVSEHIVDPIIEYIEEK